MAAVPQNYFRHRRLLLNKYSVQRACTSPGATIATMYCSYEVYRAVACDVTSAALNQNVWQKRVTFVQEKVRFNYFVAVERRIAKTTTV